MDTTIVYWVFLGEWKRRWKLPFIGFSVQACCRVPFVANTRSSDMGTTLESN